MKDFCAQFAAPPVVAGSSWEGHCDLPLERQWLPKISVRAGHVLFDGLKAKTFGDLFALDAQIVLAVRNSGKKTVAEIMALRDKVFAAGPAKFEAQKASEEAEELVPDNEPHAADFSSLADMLLKLEGTGRPQFERVMRRYMGLLNVDARGTLETCGKELKVTRERVRQISVQVAKRLFTYPRKRPMDELETVVRDMFEAHGRETKVGDMLSAVESAFGWTGTTAFSLRQVLVWLKWKIVEMPDGESWGWNEDGRFDWVATYAPPTLTEQRRRAIRAVLTNAGYAGLTVDAIQAACAVQFPRLKIAVGNVRGAMNDVLDADGTRIIPYARGVKGVGKSTYSLNTFFRDEATRKILERAAADIKAHMEKTGLGVVSVWKAWRKYRERLPLPLPKQGFYMMMRDFGAGGLSYPDYPRIAYPGITVVENTFPWEAYGYFAACRRPTATCVELMYFFTEGLGLQPSIAMACAFASMGLKKVNEDFQSPYVVRPPAKGASPALFLPTIREHLDFSLVKVPGKMAINAYYLDEDGKALTHGAYAKLFFRALEEKNFVFPAAELAGLMDKGWCKVHLKAYRPVLRRAQGEKLCSKHGYWREHFSFGGEDYFISDDWTPRNKSQFDLWAARIATLAGVLFAPYDVKGLASTAEED